MFRTLYMGFRNFQRSMRYRPQWAIAMIASFFVVGFVSLTAVPVLAGLHNFYMENQRNIYEMRIRENARASDMRESIELLLDRYPNANIKLYSPVGNTPYSYIIGQNSQRDGMDIAGLKMRENLSSAADIIWLGQGFWNAHRDLHFPQTDVYIGTRQFHVVGITDPNIPESIIRGNATNTPMITDIHGEILPLYAYTGELFYDVQNGGESSYAEDNNSHDHETVQHDFSYTWEPPFFSSIIPLSTQLTMDWPVGFMTVFLPSVPNAEDTAFINETLSGFVDDTVAIPNNAFEFTISTMLALVTAAATALCLMQLTNTVFSNLQMQSKKLYAFILSGYSNGRIARMLLMETIVFQCFGFILCILPAHAIIHWAAEYSNPRIAVTVDMIWMIGLLNLVLICVWYSGITHAFLRNIRKRGGVIE